MTRFLGRFSDWLTQRRRQERYNQAGELTGNYPRLPPDDVTDSPPMTLDSYSLLQFAAIKYSAEEYESKGKIPENLL